jgi:hypothetical protein
MEILADIFMTMFPFPCENNQQYNTLSQTAIKYANNQKYNMGKFHSSPGDKTTNQASLHAS